MPLSSIPSPRKQAALPLRQLVGSLDSLIRTMRIAEPQGRVLAERVCVAWRQQLQVELSFRPLGIDVGGLEALAGSDGQAPWVLFAFMAGLQTLRIRPDVTPDDFFRLAQELATLHPSTEAIADFHDFLWSEGAEGFDAVLSSSFVEMNESVGAAPTADNIAMVRGMTMMASDGVLVASEDLDAAAVRPEMNVTLERFVDGTQHGAFDASEAELDAMSAAVEHDASWTYAEMRALVEVPSLRAGLSPSLFARRLLGRLRPPVDQRSIEVLLLVLDSEDPYLAEASRALEREQVGTTIAQAVDLSRTRPKTVQTLLDHLSPGSRTSMLRGLLTRSVEEPRTRASLTKIFAQRGDRITQEIDPASLRGDSITGLMAVIEDEAALSRTLGELPPDALVDAMERVRPSVRRGCSQQIRQVLLEGAPDHALSMLALVASDGDADETAAGVEGLCLRRGRGVDRDTARALAKRAREHGVGCDDLIALARSPRVPEDVRLGIVDELGRVPGLRRDLVRFRMSSVLDSNVLRGRLKTLRKIDARDSDLPGAS